MKSLAQIGLVFCLLVFSSCEECVKCTIEDQNGNLVDQQEHCTTEDDERAFVREELEDLGYICTGK